MSYLQKRASTWYVRIAIPKDLFTQFEPQKEIKRSLHTGSLTQARKLAYIALGDIQQSFIQMRYSVSMPVKPVSRRAIEIYQQRYPGCSGWIPAVKGEPSLNGSGWTYEPEVLRIQTWLDCGYEPDATGDFDLCKPPQNDPATYQQQYLPERVGEVKQTPLPTPESKSITTVIEEYLFQDIHVKPITRDRKETILKRLVEYSTNKQCHEVITEDSIYKYINEFLVNLKREYGTRDNHFSALKTFSLYCYRKKYITKNTLESIKEIKITVTQADKSKKGQEVNEPYTQEQLQALLNSFMDKPATSANTRDHRFKHIQTIYYVLVAMFTGFRVQTLGQLKKDSFDFTSDVHTITVKNELIETEDGTTYNTNKTASDIKLPIVKRLEKMQFEKFVNLKSHKEYIFGATSTLDQRFDAQLVSIGMKKDKQRLHAIRGTVSNAYITSANKYMN